MCYTELVKNGMLFWADDNYRLNKSWYDSILVAWKTKCSKSQDAHIVDTQENTKLVPAHLRLIFQFENESTIHCIIHSCHYRTEKLSVLTNIWMKEFKGISISTFPLYKQGLSWKILNDLEPIYRIIDSDSIHSNCLLFPHHSCNSYVIHVQHPDQWANEFFPIS